MLPFIFLLVVVMMLLCSFIPLYCIRLVIMILSSLTRLPFSLCLLPSPLLLVSFIFREMVRFQSLLNIIYVNQSHLMCFQGTLEFLDLHMWQVFRLFNCYCDKIEFSWQRSHNLFNNHQIRYWLTITLHLISDHEYLGKVFTNSVTFLNL